MSAVEQASSPLSPTPQAAADEGGRGKPPVYNDGLLSDAALALASAHPRAAEYLGQAPVLSLSAATKFAGIVTYGDVDRFRALIAAGPALKLVMRQYGSSLPLRKVRSDTVRVGHRATLVALATIDNSTLSQCIPLEPERQYRWLEDLTDWLAHARRDGEAAHLRWAALALSRGGGHVREVADFVARGDRPLSERWSWDAAVEQAREWHRRLNADRFARFAQGRSKAPPLDPFEVICKSPLPDEVSVEGASFRVLRTRAALQEGQAMHHCVSSYASEVKAGRCAIVSVATPGERMTIEVVKGAIVQMKGICNQRPSDGLRNAAEMYVLLHGKEAA